MKSLFGLAAFVIAITPTCASAASFVVNVSGIVSTLNGDASQLKVGDTFSSTINVLSTTSDVAPESYLGWYYLTEAVGTETIGTTNGNLAFGNSPQGGISWFDIATYGTVNSAFRFLRPATDIFAGGSGNMTSALYLYAQGSSGGIKSDKLDGATIVSGSFGSSTLSQFFSAGSGERLTVGYSDVKWSLMPISAAVPEPSTWMMLILGFGAIGATMRSKRRAAAFSASPRTLT